MVSQALADIVKCEFQSERHGTATIMNTTVIGVYGHSDDNRKDTITESQLLITRILEEASELEREGQSVTILGDLNIDARRDNPMDAVVTDSTSTANWIFADLLFTQPLDYTFKTKKGQSWIDHVLCKANSSITTVNILDDADNPSDHRAIEVKLECTTPASTTAPRVKRVKAAWHDPAFSNEYQARLTAKIASMNNLTRELHMEQDADKLVLKLDKAINELHSMQRQAMEETADSMLKRLSTNISKHHKRKTWWNKEVEHAYKMQVSYYKQWERTNFNDAGAHNNYSTWRRAFRRLRRASERSIELANLKHIDNIFTRDKHAFWNAIKKLTKKPTAININIAELQKQVEKMANEKLLTNNAKENEAKERVAQFIQDHATKRRHQRSQLKIDWATVGNIIRKLPSGKAAGFAGIPPEAFKQGLSIQLTAIVTLILEKMINYNVMPHLFNLGQVKLIPKDNSNTATDTNNIRPLTISDTIANIYEKVIMHELESKWPNIDKQFGFKPRSSCEHAIFTLRETALHGIKNHKPTYACAIDASKAFDKLNRAILWDKMIGRLDDDILANLIKYYDNSLAIITNQNTTSAIFATKLGVKQGGPLSPRLFAIYLEDLVDNIEAGDMGIQAGGNAHRVNILLYADDIILVSQSIGELQAMLNTTTQYGIDHEIKFNPAKTNGIVFGGKAPANNIYLDNQPINFSNTIKYLGVTLSTKLTPTAHIEGRKTATIAAANGLRKIGIFSPAVSASLKVFLYKTYIRPVLYYGLTVQSLNKGETQDIQTFESTLVKRIIGISKYCRSTDLLDALEIETVKDKIRTTKLDLFARLSTNSTTQHTIKTTLDRPAEENNAHIHRHSVIKEALELTSTQANDTTQLVTKMLHNCKVVKNQIQEAATQRKLQQNVILVKNTLTNFALTITQRKEQLTTLLDTRN